MGSSGSSAQRLPSNVFVPSNYKPSEAMTWEHTDAVWSNLHIDRSAHSRYFKTGVNPPKTELTYKCPECRKGLYDGGLSKRRRCSTCSVISRRNEFNEVEVVGSLGHPQNFATVFEEVNSLPNLKQMQPLVSVTLGVFMSDELGQYIVDDLPQLRPLFANVLSPYFQQQTRCIGIGDYFQIFGIQFKVVGCSPSYGTVNKHTVFTCSEVFSTAPVQTLCVKAIHSSHLNERSLDEHIRPYFHKRPRHVHLGQYLFIGGQECVIVEAEPRNGVTSPETEVRIDRSTLPALNHIELVPVDDDLPYGMQFLSSRRLEAEMTSAYILPYLQGFRRRLVKGEFVRIDGVQFLVNESEPEEGVTHDNTLVFYRGNFINRNSERNSRDRVNLIQLLNVIQMELRNNARPNLDAADPKAIANLPTHEFVRVPESSEGRTCMICIAQYEFGETVKTLPCIHMFHNECIDSWLEKCGLCPICKHSVTEAGNPT